MLLQSHYSLSHYNTVGHNVIVTAGYLITGTLNEATIVRGKTDHEAVKWSGLDLFMAHKFLTDVNN